MLSSFFGCFFFFQAEDGIRDIGVTGVQTCALPICKASRSSDVPGVGLGLAIARVFVQRQGGRISLDARTQKGATFSMHLPRASHLSGEDALPPTSSSAVPPRVAPTRGRD